MMLFTIAAYVIKKMKLICIQDMIKYHFVGIKSFFLFMTFSCFMGRLLSFPLCFFVLCSNRIRKKEYMYG